MTIKKGIEYSTWISTGLLAILFVWLYAQGYITHPENLQTLLAASGWLAIPLFIALQILQTVIPIIPGGLTCALGVFAFGPFWGFVYNYIGLVLGSVAAFYLARQYGRAFILKLVKRETYDKYITWLDKGKKFDWFFALAIFAPCAPDDLLCMIAGLTSMSFKKFLCIILLGKPGALFAYSMGLTSLIGFIAR